ncbi:MAG: hypothetical protein ACOYOH_06080 [Paracraurococcus sp.]
MTQTVYNGTAGNDLIVAAAETIEDIAVFRAGAGSDTCIGGDGNDRFDGGTGADSLDGAGGNDQFFITLDNAPGVGAHDTIDGSSGVDQIIIAASGYQLSTLVQAEFARLQLFLADDAATPGSVFSSDVLKLDMTAVEVASIRLDGVLTALTATHAGPITFDDLADGAMVDYNYNGFDWLAGGVALLAAVDPAAGGLSSSGFGTGLITPANVATNLFEYEPIDIFKDDGSLFTFLQVQAISAWNSSQTVVFEGYRGGALIGSVTAILNDLAPTKVQANWGQIDTLEIHTTSATADATAASSGNNIVFDNFWLI